MKLERFLSERTDAWEELSQLVERAHGRIGRLEPEQILRVGELYRVAAADLALARRTFPLAVGTQRLQGLVIQAHSLVYSRANRTETAREFLSRGIWVRIRKNGRCLALSAAIMIGAVVLGVLWALLEPASAVGLLPSGSHIVVNSRGAFYGISVPARGGLAVTIFVNNIEVSILAIAGGFTFGILTVYTLAYNGALLGVLGVLEWKGGGFDQFLRLILPHGLLELSCIALAGAGGLSIARALIDPGLSSRSKALEAMTPQLGATLIAVVIFLIMAGLTEGFITPWDLPTGAAIGVGVLLAGGFWTMVVLRGGSRKSGPRQTRAGDSSMLATGDLLT